MRLFKFVKNILAALCYLIIGFILLLIITPVEMYREIRRKKMLDLLDLEKFDRSVASVDEKVGDWNE